MKKALLIFFVFIPACAPWTKVGGLYEPASHNFSVNIPQGWMKLNTERYLFITRDGPFLQYMLIQERPIDKAFQNTKKRIKRGMLPQEAAEVIIDEIISDQLVLHFEVIENNPAIIDRYDGFRIVFTYKNRDGLRFQTIYCGFIVGEWFYSIRYTAAQRDYFEKDIETFHKVLDSFRLTAAQET